MVQSVPVSALGTHPGSCISGWPRHIPLVSCNLWQFLCLSFSFMTFIPLKSNNYLLFKLSPNSGLSDVFSYLHWGYLFSRSVMSASLWPHGLQHTRLSCPSPSPKASSNSCPLSPWCHPTISSSVTLFSSCPQFFPASGSFPMSWLFTSGGQSIGTLASGSALPMTIQGWFPLELTGLTLQSKGLSRVFSNTIV